MGKASTTYFKILFLFNSFPANVFLLYALKTPENLWFSGDFKKSKMGTLTINEITCFNTASFFPKKYTTLEV